MTNSELTVAIVDDDETVRRALRRMITSFSFAPVEFDSGEAFLGSLHLPKIACALLDLHMPDLNGIDVLQRIKSTGCSIPIIIITGGDQPSMRQRCLEAGAAGYLVKPADRERVLSTIETCIGISVNNRNT